MLIFFFRRIELVTSIPRNIHIFDQTEGYINLVKRPECLKAFATFGDVSTLHNILSLGGRGSRGVYSCLYLNSFHVLCFFN